MVVIELGNLHCKLLEAPTYIKGIVNDALGVMVPNANFSHQYKSGMWDGYQRFYSLATGKFPSGLLTKVVEAINKAGEEVTFQDARTHIGYDLPDSIELLHSELGTITLRDYQYEAVKTALQTTRGIINVATNGGKTEIACGIIKCVLPHLPKGKKIVFFTHSKEIFTQSHKRIEERLGIKVGRIGDGLWEEGYDVIVAMIPTIAMYLSDTKIPARRDPAEFKDKVKQNKAFLKRIIAFMGDEVHHASSSTWYDVFMKLPNAYFRFGLTGTVDEGDKINLFRLLGCTGRVTTRISNKFLIDNGYSAKPTIYLLPIDTKNVDGVDYHTAKTEGIVYNEDRNRTFVSKVVERANSGLQVLVILNETEHGNLVVELLSAEGISAEFSHGKRTTKFREKVLKDFASGGLQVLVATPILDEGVDVSGINCLFLMGGGKSLRQLLQRIGRGLRKKADGSGVEVYDALDYHNEYLAEHTLERYNTYKDEGFDIVKLN